MKRHIKITGLILGTLVFLYVGWVAFWLWHGKAEDEVFILSNDFEGCVIVLFEEQSGKPKEFDKDGNRVYRIPKNGILKTQFSQENGLRDVKYIRENGNAIRYLWPSDMVWNDTININSPYKDSAYVFTGRTSKGAVWFCVGNPQDSEHWAKQMKEKWQSYSKPIITGNGDYKGIIWNSGGERQP